MNATKREIAQRILCGLARKSDLEALSPDEIRAIKSDSGSTHYRFVEVGARAARMEDEEEGQERTFEHYASTEHVDAMGDIIRQNGWDTSRLKLGKIPLFWGHDSYPVPMGLVLSAKKGKTDDGVRALVTTSRFHEKELFADSEWGKHVEAVRALVARGDLPGVSVGFIPKEYRWPESPEERESLGLGPFGVIFESAELLELSVTPIPANSRAQMKKHLGRLTGALKDLVGAGTLSEADAQELLGMLSVTEEAWMRRAAGAPKAQIAVERALPEWSARRVRNVTDERGELAPDVAAALQSLEARLAREVRNATSAVIRDALEPIEDAITSAAERIEEAGASLERAVKKPTTERADGRGAGEPTGSPDSAASSTGTCREPTRLSAKALADLIEQRG